MMGTVLNLFSQEAYQEDSQLVSVTDTEEESTIVRPIHISFITPISTNGMQSGEVTNIFSFNMIAGYSGGLQGFEVAGFANVIKGDTKGVQLAGFSNTNRGDVDAFQAAGFTNVALGEVNGMQAAGFANVARKEIRALQVAGFSNVAGGMSVGGQISGFANVNRGDAKGVQIAGFSNVNTGDIAGAQVSGFLNTARKVDGVQIGFINVADTIANGVGIGFLTFVKHGYKSFEISANETFYGNLSFKTGTERLYNIISIGASPKNNEILWGWGYGLGTMFPVSEKMKLNIEAVSFHVNEDVWFTHRLNSLNKLNVAVEYKVGKFMTVYGGPTWNVHVSQLYYVEGVPTSSSLVGWKTFDRTRNSVNVKMYPGFCGVVRF